MQTLYNIRRFSTSFVTNGVRTKTKVFKSVQSDRLIVDFEKLESKKLKKQKDFNNTPVVDASAQKLLSELLGRELPENESINSRTPFTAKELLTIFKQPNLRLQYKVLGTSGRQIQDSLLVDNDVQKFLERDDLLRAKQLAKLARFQGLFAYGTIIEYLLKKGQINDAFDIFMNLKKAGYKLKGRFYNILISGYADAISKRGGSADVSNARIEQLYRSFQKDHSDYNSEVSIIHVNSLLKVFRKGKRIDLGLSLYDSLKHLRDGKNRLKPDIRTYTELIRLLSIPSTPTDNDRNLIPFKDIVNRAETVFFNAQHNMHIKLDSYLVRAYISLYAYCGDLKLRARTITIIREWYRVSSIEEIKQQIDHKVYHKKLWEKITVDRTRCLNDEDNVRLLSSNEINHNKTKRFDPGESIIRIYKELCYLFKIPCTYSEYAKVPKDEKKKIIGKVNLTDDKLKSGGKKAAEQRPKSEAKI